MNKNLWKVKSAMAAIMCSTLLIGGQAYAATTSSAATAPIQSTSGVGAQVIQAGEKYLGTPYQYASSRADKSTMDCSEFTYWAFLEGAGVNIGKGGARSQAAKGTYVSRDNLQVGDLVFFSTPATMKYPANSIKRIGHVGIYAGNNVVLHTFGKGGVRFSNMGSGWWSDHFVTARRVLNG
ncbi:C40 family peptidase [Brevibacillus ginsengisoli]|uniref:C40 family peptidase n=1 Tax=Brevibacillus ginsengisoli TaxID=363854 RepID=UPI003CF0ACC4